MLKVGDTIKCHDAEDAAELAGELARGVRHRICLPEGRRTRNLVGNYGGGA